MTFDNVVYQSRLPSIFLFRDGLIFGTFANLFFFLFCLRESVLYRCLYVVL